MVYLWNQRGNRKSPSRGGKSGPTQLTDEDVRVDRVDVTGHVVEHPLLVILCQGGPGSGGRGAQILQQFLDGAGVCWRLWNDFVDLGSKAEDFSVKENLDAGDKQSNALQKQAKPYLNNSKEQERCNMMFVSRRMLFNFKFYVSRRNKH